MILWAGAAATLAVLVALVSSATGASSTGNIALGATVSFSQPPTYDLTADQDDSRQLTDGNVTAGTMWLSSEAVGWSSVSTPLSIDIDLGETKGIGRLCLNTARRAAAGVYFPLRVDVFVSTAPSAFAWAGRMTPLAEAGTGDYLAREFCSEHIGLLGRYVRLQVAVVEHHFFTDEITISGADDARSPLAQVPAAGLRAFTLAHEAIARSLAELRAQLAADPKAPAELQSLASRLDGSAGSLDQEALAKLDRELRRIAQEARSRRGVAVSAAFCDPWTLATPFDGRTYAGDPGVLEIGATWHATAAVAIEHAATGDVDVSVSAAVTGDGAKALTVALSRVEIVTRADGVRLGDALVPLVDGRLRVPRGETRQLWIDLAAGTVASELEATLVVEIRMDDGVHLRLERPIRIFPQPRVSAPPFTVVWGYLDWRPIEQRPREAALDMLAHGITTAVLPAGHALPWPTGSAQPSGKTIGDYGSFDKVMKDLEGHDQYLFFLSFNPDSSYRNQLGPDFMSPRWQQAFTAWIREWTQRLHKAGIGPDRYAFYPVDEPDTADDIETLTSIARLVKSVDPALRIYTTLFSPDALTDDLIGAVDVIQLNGPAISTEAIARLKARGKSVGSYATEGGGKGGDPDAFYRALGWDAFARGLDGFGFWAYADTGVTGSGWNDIDDVRPDFAVVYEGETILSSKRWEAWREGVQDNLLLRAASEGAADQAARDRVVELARQAETSGYGASALAAIRKRLRLIAATGRDPGA
jgi:hypothetical protein